MPANGCIIGESEPIRKIFKIIERVATGDSTVIIYGESGTGKELVARAIHQASWRKEKPFVAINCGAIPENLLESELFGHTRGAFTGATASRAGKFQLANGGAIFLDEIGDMSLNLQVKLLRVLEEREIERVGGSDPIRLDVQVISATHRDLEEAVAQGRFREDLYYRLHVIPIRLPALRERPTDIPLLFSHFLNEINQAKRCLVEGISAQAMECLMEYHWPGNVRELRNVAERLVVLKGEGMIAVDDLPDRILKKNMQAASFPTVKLSGKGVSLNTAVTEFEKALILQSLEKTHWVKQKAAELLNVNRTTLVEKIKRYNLEGDGRGRQPTDELRRANSSF